MNSFQIILFRWKTCFLAVLIVLGANTTPVYSAGLNIVTTTSDLASIAKAIAGPHATTTSICAGKEDPHFIQAKPSYILAARDADLWCRVGMELEVGWEPVILDVARNPKIRVGAGGHLDACEKVLRLDVPTGRVTRAMGDVHPMGNPHYWLDPLNGRIVAQSIAQRLISLDPSHAKVFQKNLKAFESALDQRMFGKPLVEAIGGEKLWIFAVRGQLDDFLARNHLTEKLGGWMAKMRPFRGRSLVSYHRSWNYFANRFGLKITEELEPKPGIPPSPAHLAEVIQRMRSENARVILQEPFYSRRAADRVAGSTGAKVVVVANSVGGQAQASDYLALIDLIVDRVAKALDQTAPAK